MKTVDILRKAKEIYESGRDSGMCACIYEAIGENPTFYDLNIIIKEKIPLFCYTVAVKKFEATGNENTYWWNKITRKSRLDYFDWLIKQYKNK